MDDAVSELPLDHKQPRGPAPFTVGPALIGDSRPLAAAWREWLASLDPAVQVAVDERLAGKNLRKSVRTAWHKWLWRWGLKDAALVPLLRAMATPPPGWRAISDTECVRTGTPPWMPIWVKRSSHFNAGRHHSGRDLFARSKRCGQCAFRRRRWLHAAGWYCHLAEDYTWRQSPACDLFDPLAKKQIEGRP